MTAIQLNAEILRNLGALAEDEGMLKRVAKYLRKLVAEKEADPTLMSKEEFFARGSRRDRYLGMTAAMTHVPVPTATSIARTVDSSGF